MFFINKRLNMPCNVQLVVFIKQYYCKYFINHNKNVFHILWLQNFCSFLTIFSFYFSLVSTATSEVFVVLLSFCNLIWKSEATYCNISISVTWYWLQTDNYSDFTFWTFNYYLRIYGCLVCTVVNGWLSQHVVEFWPIRVQSV